MIDESDIDLDGDESSAMEVMELSDEPVMLTFNILFIQLFIFQK